MILFLENTNLVKQLQNMSYLSLEAADLFYYFKDICAKLDTVFF